MNEDIRIVPAKSDDARAIQELFRTTWLATYPNAEVGITVEDIKESLDRRFTEEELVKRKVLMANPPENELFLVAKEREKVIGFCHVAKHPDKNQLKAIYVLPGSQGKGIGKSLWEEGRKFLDLTKDTFVETAAYNAPSISFCKKLGSEDTGKRFEEERFRMKSGSIIPEMEMVLKHGKAANFDG